MIAIIDYDAGNIRSVEKAILHLGEEAVITRDHDVIRKADKVVLPGVGCFGDAMERIRSYDLEEDIRYVALEKKTPFLGICLGLQLLFAESEETPGVKGLNLLPGKVVRIPAEEGLKIPHIGWNSLHFPKESRLFKGLSENSYVYFVHSYYLQAQEKELVAATCQYGSTVMDVAVEQGNIFATQFHPEKSSDVGLRIIQNFLSI
ncbi:MAG: imidazole glycerol phosphate synthase subunit HisH [Lachnospiraceae bacterium]|nr:imidazole glycerol phosphate synthase subunit HisH [Lachnospiraceae bacterium]